MKWLLGHSVYIYKYIIRLFLKYDHLSRINWAYSLLNEYSFVDASCRCIARNRAWLFFPLFRGEHFISRNNVNIFFQKLYVTFREEHYFFLEKLCRYIFFLETILYCFFEVRFFSQFYFIIFIFYLKQLCYLCKMNFFF